MFTGLKQQLKGTEFWFDSAVLASLWIAALLLPEEYTFFHGLSGATLLKILALIGSIEMIGFFSFHLGGAKAGLLIQGLLGGFVSSTMTYLQFTRREDVSPPDTRIVSNALLLATVSMLIEGVLIIMTIRTENGLSLAAPLLVQMVVLLLIVVFSGKGKEGEAAPLRNEINITEPIIWKKVIYFGLFIMGLIFGMRVINDLFSLPYLWSSFIVSLFEAHGVLAAAMTEYKNIGDEKEALHAVFVIMAGNVISKTFFVMRARTKAIRRPVLTSLYLSLGVAALILFF